jgi:hypothetical protein
MGVGYIQRAQNENLHEHDNRELAEGHGRPRDAP